MKEGTIVEQGNHDNLMKLNRDYAAMYNHFQLGDMPNIEVPVCRSTSASVSLPVLLSLWLSFNLPCLSIIGAQQKES